ncbi:hypothetical protein SDC9_72146 [bioreactor metagenome]|uniref:Uncharacterized protein n=1 Tax=bioreactor metagenome TaxID=1076179 RepID=A0A644YBH5_9ZZZZ
MGKILGEEDHGHQKGKEAKFPLVVRDGKFLHSCTDDQGEHNQENTT